MKMSSFRVELKKVIDDSYDIEIGKGLSEKLLTDIQNGLVGNISKFVVVTDSNVKELYAEHILHNFSIFSSLQSGFNKV